MVFQKGMCWTISVPRVSTGDDNETPALSVVLIPSSKANTQISQNVELLHAVCVQR